MIYITVGTYPNGFDDLIKIMDEIATKRKDLNFLAQISGGKYIPKYIQYKQFFNKKDHIGNIKSSSCIVTHPGVGSIDEIAQFPNKKIVVYPRINGLHDEITSAKLLKKYYSFILVFSKEEIIKQLNTVNLGYKKNNILIKKKSNTHDIIKNFLIKNI